MFDKLEKSAQRLLELESLLGDPKVIADKLQYQKFAKEFSELLPVVEAFRNHRKLIQQIGELQVMLKEKHDQDFRELAMLELKDLEEQKLALEKKLDDILNPKIQEQDVDLIFEIRAGTGGQEASLFAADLYRMYSRYAEAKGWKVDSLSHHESDAGGFKEVIFGISGKGAARRLKWEGGIHRVQRVPLTEASGRIHTSAATVAVLPEPQEIEIKIDPKDLKIDVYRSSGPGGQSVNTTDSAVRITHLTSGIVVVCQDERSQLKNRLKAMRVLRARLHDKILRENIDKETQSRKAMVGTGDRSEKIRTYNFPDRRITDHRIGFTSHQFQKMIDGDLDEITDALLKAELENRMGV